MIKNVIILTILAVFALSAAGVYAQTDGAEAKARASKAMDNIFYGPVEVPANLTETNSKGTAVEGCTAKTRDGVERGIARLVGGIWQLATFWYTEPSSKSSK